jgi:hypothetical protein
VCIHLLPASFVCALKPFVSSGQVTKVQKTMGPGIEPICGVSVIWPFCFADLLGLLASAPPPINF